MFRDFIFPQKALAAGHFSPATPRPDQGSHSTNSSSHASAHLRSHLGALRDIRDHLHLLRPLPAMFKQTGEPGINHPEILRAKPLAAPLNQVAPACAGNTRSLAHTLLSRVTPSRGRKVYLLDFAAYKPDEECVP